MTDHLRHWDALKKTDPAHTKRFDRAGGFKGTATKPIYLIERLTEHFGPAGIGWGTTEPRFHVERIGEDVLVFCTIGLWYLDADKRSEPVYGTGGDNLRLNRKAGPLPNDEAFKAAQTDALSNAMKLIGVLADIHMGMHDDDKYVRSLKEEFAEENAAPAAQQKLSEVPKVIAGVDVPLILEGVNEAKTPKALTEWVVDNGGMLGEILKKAPEAYDMIAISIGRRALSLFQSEIEMDEWLKARTGLTNRMSEQAFNVLNGAVVLRRSSLKKVA